MFSKILDLTEDIIDEGLNTLYSLEDLYDGMDEDELRAIVAFTLGASTAMDMSVLELIEWAKENLDD